MSLRLGDTAPDFAAESTEGTIQLPRLDRRQLGRALLAPQGLHARVHDRARYVARLKPEFDKRGVKVIGLSVDPVDLPQGWAADIKETQGHAVNFPIIADPEKQGGRPLRHDASRS